MTISKFERLLQKIDPRLRVRQRSVGDVAGLFIGYSGKSGYICRMTKGELHLNGFRFYYKDDAGKLQSRIQKRGRKTIINLLRNYRWVTTQKQRSMLLWGIEYPDSEVVGLSSRKGGSNV